MRLFFAIQLPEQWKHTLGALQRRLEARYRGYVRWVHQDLLHLTIVFLGYQAEEDLGRIIKAGRRAAASVLSFELAPGVVGSFGPRHRPRVIWVGVMDETSRLQRLHAATSRALTREGIAFDERPLAPHITLGRAQREGDVRAGRALAADLAASRITPPRLAPFAVEALALVQSELSREGSRYTEVARLPLARGPTGHAND